MSRKLKSLISINQYNLSFTERFNIYIMNKTVTEASIIAIIPEHDVGYCPLEFPQ